MEKTLNENNVDNEASTFKKLGVPEDYYYPIIHLYFNDDLTVA